MAAAIKALNAKIRSNPVTDYFCSTRTFLPCRHPGHNLEGYCDALSVPPGTPIFIQRRG